MIDSKLVTRLEELDPSDKLSPLLLKAWEDGENAVFSLVMNLLCS